MQRKRPGEVLGVEVEARETVRREIADNLGFRNRSHRSRSLKNGAA